ncbi:hypothetical protein M407DRAFT_32280 [Tulasnella calospora MUT 4182]|uniref:Uncharacterized protein n=1 Tax=Tulasnella calospora MUT 4182 TaxID=1051891 RepID=A0A0C3Q486_9AGAM|nr:hypothetical protein M407DRAFT_32280 [Tulasnella calospora MUT 4182]
MLAEDPLFFSHSLFCALVKALALPPRWLRRSLVKDLFEVETIAAAASQQPLTESDDDEYADFSSAWTWYHKTLQIFQERARFVEPGILAPVARAAIFSPIEADSRRLPAGTGLQILRPWQLDIRCCCW